ncbi:NBS-LRR disease resistance protein NBS48 [Cinnamomum micranthum f. kanehirae]|uniref:NBS-LRR disease resistance protein NBS48 n=1 Tax=Cinnamomum micranthum f. kanehirae TaxID=337451 RepID=A0A3S5WGJ0_9MAGN|nr:NBS-LRR disease resistance protein NBS48 [Cinnamomum micranthum f. kanehirae]
MDSTISMVTSKVVDAGLSSLFQGLFDKLAPPFLKSLGFLFGVGGETDKLKLAFSRIQALLNDAEDRQIKDELIRLWLRELKDAAYDAEDILDEVEYVVLRSKLEEPMQTRKRKRDQVSDLFSCFVSNLNLGPRIKEIRERLEEIESRSNHLHLKVILKSERLVPGKRPPSGSIIDGSIVFGRETDREKLRYLDLSCTDIERLPKSITRLCNLQFLGLAYCSKLVGVPSDFSKLVNLREILLKGCSASIPFGGLTSLRNLKVGREIGYRVNELRDMIHLRESLQISGLENVISVEEAKEAELKNKQKIICLKLKWEYHDVDSRQEGIEEEVLNALQPHTNLEHLKIKGYCGVRFPTWLWDSSFSKLVSISLVKCKCPLLPPFGQLPSLECLSLNEIYGLEKVGREVYGDGMVKAFPSLKTLLICSMPDLEEWTALEDPVQGNERFSSAMEQTPPTLLLLRRRHSPQFLQSSDRLEGLERSSSSGCHQHHSSSLIKILDPRKNN